MVLRPAFFGNTAHAVNDSAGRFTFVDGNLNKITCLVSGSLLTHRAAISSTFPPPAYSRGGSQHPPALPRTSIRATHRDSLKMSEGRKHQVQQNRADA